MASDGTVRSFHESFPLPITELKSELETTLPSLYLIFFLGSHQNTTLIYPRNHPKTVRFAALGIFHCHLGVPVSACDSTKLLTQPSAYLMSQPMFKGFSHRECLNTTLASLFREDGRPVKTFLDWEEIVSEAVTECVLPAVAEQVRLLGLEKSVPERILSLLVLTEALNAERNQVILGEAIHVATLLNSIGVEPVALKGIAYLLMGVYENPGMRFMTDVDFLVPDDRSKESVIYLKEHGYFENASEQFFQFRHHHPGLRRSGLPHVEIHHRIGQGICNRLLPASKIIAGAESITIGSAKILIPCPTDLTNHLIIHSQLAHPYKNRVFPPVRALIDLVHIQARFACQIDWSSLAKTYTANGQSPTLTLHLAHVNRMLGTHFPAVGTPRWRWYRRVILNRYPKLRFLDPAYLVMALLSRRLRLLPEILRHPDSWYVFVKEVTSVSFYRRMLEL